MAIITYKDPVTGDYIPVKTKTIDTLPVGTEVDFDGNEVPSGWTETDKTYKSETYSLSGQTVTAGGSLELGIVPTISSKTFIGAFIKNGKSIAGLIGTIVDKGSSKIYLLCSNAQTFGSNAEVTITYMYADSKKIKKTSQYIEGGASLSNVYGTSNENGYTQEYINGIIESGGTADNYYVKYADGTLICAIKDTRSVAITTSAGAIYRCTAISTLPNFASSFYSVPIINITTSITASSVSFTESTTTNVGKVFVTSPASMTEICTFNIIAIGRWKALGTAQNTRSIPSENEIEEPIEDENQR